MKKNQFVTSLLASLLLTAVGISSAGCGKPGFSVEASKDTAPAPGHYIVPAKVDILLVQDDTGSIFEPFSQLSQQMPAFLSAIQGKGWDYHFAVVPLTQLRPLAHVTASPYDSNWGSQWQPPYPGAVAGVTGTILSSVFSAPTSDFPGFLIQTDLSNTLQGREPGLQSLLANLGDASMKSTSFLRDDALLVVLIVGNGNDTSGINYCVRSSDGVTVPCEMLGHPLCGPGVTDPNCGSEASSLASYESQLQTVKATPSQLRVFAAVAAQNHINNTCMGGNSYAGTRYMNVASAFGGQSFDICSTPISGILDSLDSELAGTRLSMETRYLFMAQEPEPSSIAVTKNGVTVPQDPANGWTYAGFVSNVYTIDAPINMNQASGWAIELHGSAKLVGDDTSNVTYLPKGAQNTN